MAKDPYRYFRVEARELLESLGRGVLELEKQGGGKEPISQLLRVAHTLKGASRVVRQAEIAEGSHQIEELLAPHREGGSLPMGLVDRLLALVDGIGERLQCIDAIDAPTPQLAAHVEESQSTVRVDLEEMDALLNSVAEVSVQLGTLRREVHASEQARLLAGELVEQLALLPDGGTMRLRALAEDLRARLGAHETALALGVGQTSAEFAQVRDATNRLRLLPAWTLRSPLERTARDAAQALGKHVSLTLVGGDVRLDSNLVSVMGHAFLHLVRNAVAHGIELPDLRAKAQKTIEGRIVIEVDRRGANIVFRCRDDGAGIDVEAVRRVASARGLLSMSQGGRFGLDEAAKVLLRGGITTARSADEVSGRGVGLDAVQTMVTQLRGTTSLSSERGKGTSFEITVPFSRTAIHALTIEASGAFAAVPLDAVVATVRVSSEDIARSSERDALVYDGHAIPFLPLARALQNDAAPSERPVWTAIVLSANNELAAIGVDRLHDTSEVIVRPVPALVEADPVVIGMSLDADGAPRLVLDVETLVMLARQSHPTQRPARAAQPPILIVDDSLTTRMLEQAILESAGYEVELATSGEEGIDKALARDYGLFLVDVEMPGIDGFEFVARTRADPRLRGVPAILVTSRDAEDDRRRGVSVGASGYIVKGEFDQVKLLETIRTLVAGA